MYRTRFFAALIVLAVVALAGLARTTPVRAASNPIHIVQCFISEPKPLSKKAGGTQIDYVNNGSKTAKHVTFGVGYRNSENRFYRKVTDDGSFEPGAEIKHHFALYNDVTYGGKATTSCSALSVKWSDGTTWIAQ